MTSNDEVVGYYSLAVGSVSRVVSVSRVRRNMLDSVPIMLLARLAIDRNWQGRGLGRSLLRDAVLRTIQAADIVGIRALLVHAISDEARRFCQFTEFWRALIASDDADECRTNASPGRGSQPELTEELREQLRSLGYIP